MLRVADIRPDLCTCSSFRALLQISVETLELCQCDRDNDISAGYIQFTVQYASCIYKNTFLCTYNINPFYLFKHFLQFSSLWYYMMGSKALVLESEWTTGWTVKVNFHTNVDLQVGFSTSVCWWSPCDVVKSSRTSICLLRGVYYFSWYIQL